MIIGVPREIKDNEYRVSVLPSGVKILTGNGHTVLIESSAGIGSGISDEDYKSAGAEIIKSAEDVFKRSDIIAKVKEPLPQEYPLLRAGQVIFTFLHLASNRVLTDTLMKKGVVAIAYESVQLDDGTLPLLVPMSAIAGRWAPIAATYFLQEGQGGSGVLISGIPGVMPGKVTILGAGTVGQNAARIAIGMGADVVMLDRNIKHLKHVDEIFCGRVTTITANGHNIEKEVLSSDIIIGAVLIPGAKAPFLVRRELVAGMRKGSVIVDVSIDQGGCIETSRPTSHSNPVFVTDGVIHYCVVNMPGAFPRTSTLALCNVTIPYISELANLGWQKAVKEDRTLIRGLNIAEGKLTNPAVADTFGYKYEPF